MTPSNENNENEGSNRQDAESQGDTASSVNQTGARGGRGGRPDRPEADPSGGEGSESRRHSLKRRYDAARRDGQADRSESRSESRDDASRPSAGREGGAVFRRRSPDDRPRRDSDDRPRRGPDDRPRRGPSDRPRRGPDDRPRRGPSDRPRRGASSDRRRGPDDRPRRDSGDGFRPRREESRRDAFSDSPRPTSSRPPATPPPAASKRQPAGQRLADIDTLEVKVEKLISGGDGIARFEGIPIFIPRAAPGDHLRVRIVERKPSFGRAEILEILKPGPGRRDAPCPHYEACGGCQLQHLDEAEQLKGKAQAARDNLERLGGLTMPSDIRMVAGEPWGYRLRAQWQVADTPRGRQVGYYARGSHDLVAVDRCPVLAPDLERRLEDVQGAASDIVHRRLDVCVGEEDAWTASPAVKGLPSQAVSMQVGDFTYQYDAGCFFQAHRHLIDRLVAEALGPDSTPPSGNDKAVSSENAVAYDLYSGVGLFSLPLARRYAKVVAVEGGREAARYGRRNVQLNRLDNVEVINQAVDTWVAELPEDAARVLVDPPRVGLSGPVRQALLDRPPRRLTYVSCDSATLARDLKYLKSGFRVLSLALLDMFPQTGHLEAVVQLERSSSSGR